MLHPVGSHSPSVYWRRRFLLFGSLALVIVLIVLTVRAVTSGGGDGQPAAAGTQSTAASDSTTPATPSDSAAGHGSGAASSTPSRPARTSGSGSSGTAAGNDGGTFSGSPKTCTRAQLKVAAAVGKHKYTVGDEPNVMLQVINTGPDPCVQDLADRQVVLEIYNGASRVWGSHDCHIEPGVHKRTLGVDKPVRVSIIWSGLSSRPHCEGTRQRVGAGTYTLYASLSGHRGAATQFSIAQRPQG